MNRKHLVVAALGAFIAWGLTGCRKSGLPETTDLTVLADAVPSGGPREGNNYKVFVKVLRVSADPAPGFKVEAWVKGKGDPVTLTTDRDGIAKFLDLPFPNASQRLNISFHYYKGKVDQSRAIEYPYLATDAYRMKDTQYIPNDATPDPR